MNVKIRIAIGLLILGIGVYAYKSIQTGVELNASVEHFATSLNEPQKIAQAEESITAVSNRIREAARSNEQTRNSAFILVCLSGLIFTHEYCRHGNRPTQQDP